MCENFYDLLASVGLEYNDRDNSIGVFRGRRVMFAPHSMMLFIGAKEFDRWSISTEVEFDLSTSKDCKRLDNYIKRIG